VVLDVRGEADDIVEGEPVRLVVLRVLVKDRAIGVPKTPGARFHNTRDVT
jgi:hypothetical protein